MDLSLWSFWLGIFALVTAGVIHFPFEVFSMWRLHLLVRLLSVIALVACTYTVANGVYWAFHFNYEVDRGFIENRSIGSRDELIAVWIWPYWPYIAMLYGVLMGLLYLNYTRDPKGTSDKLDEERKKSSGY